LDCFWSPRARAAETASEDKAAGLKREISYCLFICECSDTNCAESLEITAAEYEAVRAEGTRFVVTPGHQLQGIERVVYGNRRFFVVEKLGQAGEIADNANPRR
jgi:hypothetical protein